MRAQIVIRYTGLVLLFNGAFLSIAALISLVMAETSFPALFYSAVISLVIGAFPLIYVPPTKKISNNEGFLIVTISWLSTCIIGALPYILWGGEFTFTNAWFESVSGFTTTGASILTDIEALPRGLLFWRSTTHWIGGVGIVIFVLSVLPTLGEAGKTLLNVEMSSMAKDNFHYRTKKVLQILMVVYISLTAAETIALSLCGMNLFDAVLHSFATIATGGFSTKNMGIAHYHSLSIEMVVMVFMFLSGIHFGLLFAALMGKISVLWKSAVTRYYGLIIIAGILLVSVNIHGKVYTTWCESVRYGAFQVLSLSTSTGFATANSDIWPSLSVLLLIFFTLQCACAGSTSGGIKVDRIILFLKSIKNTVIKLQHPRAVLSLKMDDESQSEITVTMGNQYILIYVLVVFVSSLFLAALGVDLLSAFSGAAAAMGNVGPGFSMVNSMSNYSQIPGAGKWILSVDMLLGRLEIFGLLYFLVPRSWR